MVIFKLVISDVWQRRMRAALTVFAIALSVSLVVAVTTGYSSVRATIFKYFLEYVGRTDVEIRNVGGEISQDVIAQIKADKDVAGVVGRLEIKSGLVDLDGKAPKEQATATFIGVKPPDDVELTGLKMEPGTNGRWFSGQTGRYAVIDQRVAEVLNVSVGGEILLPAQPKTESAPSTSPLPTTNPFGPPLKLRVVAIIHKPQIAAFFNQTVYVPLETLQDFTGNRGKVTRVMVDLKPGVNDQDFVKRWRPAFPSLKLKPASESRKEVDDRLHGVEMLSFMGGTISMLAATFIVFSTLSMGIVERQRMLAMLRAVGTTRWQIAHMVVLEGIVLAISGAAIGVPAGLVWVKLLAMWKEDYFLAGVVPSVGGIAYGTLGSVLAAMAASILPALMASRSDVIEGITATGQPPSPKVPWMAAAVGALFMAVDPLLMFAPKVFGERGLFSDKVTYNAHFIVGIPAVMVGFFLLAPSVVWLMEKTLGRVVSLALGIRHTLLAHQLSGSIWRSAGTAAALMVGLSILVVLQTQGNSLLGGWRLPDRFPDIFIFANNGLSPESVKAIEGIEGIWKHQVLPIAFNKWRLELSAVSPIGADSAMFFGVDPQQALQMMGLEFIEGNATEAVRLLESRERALKLIDQDRCADAAAVLKGTQYEPAIPLLQQGKANEARQTLLGMGGYVIVTDELRQLKGLHQGSKIKLGGPLLGKAPPPYTVAAVVWSPALDLFVSQFDMMQQFEERSLGSAFGTMEDAQRDFKIDKIYLFAANLVGGVDKNDIEKRVREKVGAMGLIMGDTRVIKWEVTKGFQRLLALMSLVAMAAIVVASLGVTNTIVASIRTRRWQLGVLRSVGLTQGQMLRLILAEALLLGMVACALGVTAGLGMSIDANRFGWWVFGYQPPIQVPWDVVGTGVLIILGVAFLASLWPALTTARKEPLELLQGGRAG